MRRIAYSARARRDLAEIVSYISKDDPAAAIRVRDRIIGVVEGLRALSTGRRSAIEGAFEKIVPDLPYIVYYAAAPGEIRIITVRHTARRPLRR